jgi:hypothetical protein
MQKLSEISSAVRGAALKLRAALGFGAGGPPAVAPLRRPLFDLAKESDELFALEVQTGCFGEVERSIEALSQAILQDSFDCAAGAESDVPDRVWISLLRLGLFEELRYLVLHRALPIRDEVKAFIDFCAREYALCQQRGEALRASHPDRDIFTLGFIVWGREYVDNFLRYGLRSMLSKGNLPALSTQGQVVFSIVTDVAGEAQIRSISPRARARTST